MEFIWERIILRVLDPTAFNNLGTAILCILSFFLLTCQMFLNWLKETNERLIRVLEQSLRNDRIRLRNFIDESDKPEEMEWLMTLMDKTEEFFDNLKKKTMLAMESDTGKRIFSTLRWLGLFSLLYYYY